MACEGMTDTQLCEALPLPADLARMLELPVAPNDIHGRFDAALAYWTTPAASEAIERMCGLIEHFNDVLYTSRHRTFEVLSLMVPDRALTDRVLAFGLLLIRVNDWFRGSTVPMTFEVVPMVASLLMCNWFPRIRTYRNLVTDWFIFGVAACDSGLAPHLPTAHLQVRAVLAERLEACRARMRDMPYGPQYMYETDAETRLTKCLNACGAVPANVTHAVFTEPGRA